MVFYPMDLSEKTGIPESIGLENHVSITSPRENCHLGVYDIPF